MLKTKQMLVKATRCLISTNKELLGVLEDGYAMKSGDPVMRSQYIATINLVGKDLKEETRIVRIEAQNLRRLKKQQTEKAVSV